MSDQSMLRSLLAHPMYAGMEQQSQQSPMGGGMKLADALDLYNKMNGKIPGISEQGAFGPGGLSGAVAGVNALQPAANGQWLPPPMPPVVGV